jgi:hypothetical protein
MRYADSATLLALNDRAKLIDLGQWLKVVFFDDLDPDGVHVLAYAFPHGVRPGSGPRSKGKPPHYRTAWYAAMRDGSDWIAALDVLVEDYDELPTIDGEPDELVGRVGDHFELPAVVAIKGMNDDGRHVVIDGRHVAEAARMRGESTLPTLVLEGLSAERLAEIRTGLAGDEAR